MNNIIKLTKPTKALLQMAAKCVHLSSWASNDNRAGRCENLLKVLLLQATHQDKFEDYASLGNYVACFATLDRKGDSAMRIILDDIKMRDFEIEDWLYQDVLELVDPFIRDWMVISEGHDYGRHITITKDAAFSQLVIAAVVQLLSESGGKLFLKSETLLDLFSRNEAFRDYHSISGDLWMMGLEDPDSIKAYAYVTHFTINLHDGKINREKTIRVEVEDYYREREIVTDYSIEPDEFELER